MADVALTTEPKLDLGRVARDTLAVTGKRPAFVLGLSFLLSGLPVFFRPLYEHAPRHVFSGGGLVNWIVMILLNAFLSACLYRLAIRELDGETPTPNEVVTSGAQLFLPLLAVNILYCLAVAGGAILLVVPGIMIAVAWCVAGPALIEEQTGITQSFGRSAQLTRGNRWRIFGLFLLFALGAVFVQAIFTAVGFAVSFGSETLFSGPRLLGSALLSTAITALATPGVAAVYVQLRELKGG